MKIHYSDYILHLQRFHYMILRKEPGTRREFAERLGVSEKMVVRLRRTLLALGAEVHYDRLRGRYVYLNEFVFQCQAMN